MECKMGASDEPASRGYGLSGFLFNPYCSSMKLDFRLLFLYIDKQLRSWLAFISFRFWPWAKQTTPCLEKLCVFVLGRGVRMCVCYFSTSLSRCLILSS
jgi:hypothetical protein